MTESMPPEKAPTPQVSAPAAGKGSEVPVENKPVSEMTPEEQMAQFEKDLKENDWGHQPC